jgi:hypothetical protein
MMNDEPERVVAEWLQRMAAVTSDISAPAGASQRWLEGARRAEAWSGFGRAWWRMSVAAAIGAVASGLWMQHELDEVARASSSLWSAP